MHWSSTHKWWSRTTTQPARCTRLSFASSSRTVRSAAETWWLTSASATHLPTWTKSFRALCTTQMTKKGTTRCFRQRKRKSGIGATNNETRRRPVMRKSRFSRLYMTLRRCLSSRRCFLTTLVSITRFKTTRAMGHRPRSSLMRSRTISLCQFLHQGTTQQMR
jgi:hypothetical protein